MQTILELSGLVAIIVGLVAFLILGGKPQKGDKKYEDKKPTDIIDHDLSNPDDIYRTINDGKSKFLTGVRTAIDNFLKRRPK